MTETSVLAAIDAALACQRAGCDAALTPGSPHPDFCSEDCWELWQSARTGNPPPDGETSNVGPPTSRPVVRVHRAAPDGQVYVPGNRLLIEVDGSQWGHVLAEIAGSQPQIVGWQAPARPFGESDAAEVSRLNKQSLAMLQHMAAAQGMAVVAVSDLRLDRDRSQGYPAGLDMVWRRQGLAVPLVLGAFSGMYAG